MSTPEDKDLCDYCVLDHNICCHELCHEATVKYIACNVDEFPGVDQATADKWLSEKLLIG